MASMHMKPPCIKCSKAAGITTCNGCQQVYCINHFNEHRQELANQMEIISQKRDLLRQSLDNNITQHPLFCRINTWEQESINKIQIAAETARTELRELLDRTKNELEKSISKLTEELRSSREFDDYTEIDIKKWTQELRILRKTFKSSSSISISEDESLKLIIPLISVHSQQQQQYRSSYLASENFQDHILAIEKSVSSSERFDEIIGKAITSEECLVITCNAMFISYPIIYGSNRYSSGTHHIHYRIDKIGNSRIFFGITPSYTKITQDNVNDKSINGWWDLARAVVNGEAQKSDDHKFITTGDDVILTLDCDNRQIQLQHNRTNRLVQLFIDVVSCPFPWKTVVKLGSKGDSIRILQ
ncbi:unnamed protein product [Rotaria sp. Silwood1]|nr:unnamed protein product [Rotaria sp. Silwood1]CAF3374913.1 unnamed protein product [Rotaria sp. Silwood1]CAF3403693.1 unnamed protein product [Rotaria sp. Silwood1]CAF4499227.1 unnamed protein product [Rotaria sp. Silwood1]CAF4631798.1 unnamed protein product [Rotaria sp. Silwood1]